MSKSFLVLETEYLRTLSNHPVHLIDDKGKVDDWKLIKLRVYLLYLNKFKSPESYNTSSSDLDGSGSASPKHWYQNVFILSTNWMDLGVEQEYVKGEEICFNYCDVFRTASQTSWREYVYIQPTK